jgi:hypothetical protein
MLPDDLTIETVVQWITAAIAIASIITATTPTPKDDTILGKFYKFIEMLAIVVGKAKDKQG